MVAYKLMSVIIGLGLAVMGLFMFNHFNSDSKSKDDAKLSSLSSSPQLNHVKRQFKPTFVPIEDLDRSSELKLQTKPPCQCYGCDGKVQNTSCSCKTCQSSPRGVQTLGIPKETILYLDRVSLGNLDSVANDPQCAANTDDCTCAAIFYSESNILGTKGIQYFYDKPKKQGVLLYWTELKHTYQQCAKVENYFTRIYDSKSVLKRITKEPKSFKFTPFKFTLTSKMIASNGEIYIFYNCEKSYPHLLVYTTRLRPESSVYRTTQTVEALLKTTSLKADKLKWKVLNENTTCSYPTKKILKYAVKMRIK